MSYKQIKWLILIIPTVTIGLWEYVRHEFLLPYISMELGNFLAPVIVFLVTMLLLTKLFAMLERMQEELQRSKSVQAVLQEREHLASELHDGIAQSLFLVSVKVKKLADRYGADGEQFQSVLQTVHEVNHYVRQAIANLRVQPDPNSLPWMESLTGLMQEFERDTGVSVELDWTLPEERLSVKEKVALYASVREALLNVRKHADARKVWIRAGETPGGWHCDIADDGRGYTGDPFQKDRRFGLKILRDRARELGWRLSLKRRDELTVVRMEKGEDRDDPADSRADRG